MSQQFLTANSYFGLAKETSRGTLPASGAVFIPVTSPQVTPTQTFIRDEAFRGSPTMVFDQVQGVRHDEYDFKTYLFADTFPNYMVALLGGPDTKTGSGAYSHSIGLYNNSATGSQPSSYSLLDFDGANYFTITGAQASDATVSFGAEVAADIAVKFMGNPYTSYTTAPSPFGTLSLSTEHLIPAWNTSITVGGTASGGTVTGGTAYTYVSTGELKIDRKTAPIFTMGTQAPHTVFAGPLEVSGKFTAVLDSQSDPWSTGSGASALTRDPLPLVITLTDPNDTSVTNAITFQMSAVQFQNVKRTRGKDYVEVEIEFTANANSNDSGSSSTYSPLLTITQNAISTTY